MQFQPCRAHDDIIAPEKEECKISEQAESKNRTRWAEVSSSTKWLAAN